MTDGAGAAGAGPVRGRATRAAVRAGLQHGWIELSHCFTMFEDAFEILPMPLLSIVALLVIGAKHAHLPGTHSSIGSTVLAGVLVTNVIANGIIVFGMRLTAEREDGTCGIVEGTYQSPILVQWQHAPRQTRILDVTLSELR